MVKEKLVTIAKYIPEVARSLAILSLPPEKLDKQYRELEARVRELLISSVSSSIEMPKIDGRRADPRALGGSYNQGRRN